MVSQNQSSRNKFHLTAVCALLLGAPLFLTACHSHFGPYPMPSGYTYHERQHKAPPGPEPVLKKIEHMEPARSVDGHHHKDCPETCPEMYNGHHHMSSHGGMHATPAATVTIGEPLMASGPWDNAAQDLVRRLVNGFGTPVEPVFIRPADMGSASEIAMERALRGAMTQSGFTLAPAPGMGPYTLHYAATPLQVGDGSRMMVTITLAGDNGAVAEESGIYAVGSPRVMAPPPAPHEHGGPAMAEPLLLAP